MHIYLIRHAHTSLNNIHGLFSKTDSPLDKSGVIQAELLGYRLRNTPLNYIFSSPLMRAKQTAIAIKHFHPQLKIAIEPQFKEVEFGTVEGTVFSELKSKHNIYFGTAIQEYNFKYPQGDSLAERVMQLKKLFNPWLEQYQNQHIVIVTHGFIAKGIMIALKTMQFDEEFRALKLQNASITIIKPQDSSKIQILNDTRHLSILTQLKYKFSNYISCLR